MHVEVTGPICSGKSYLLSANRKAVNPIYALIGFVYLAFAERAGFCFLLKKIKSSDRDMIHVIRVGVHVFAKFGFRIFNKYSDQDCLIDEGISHIPFMLILKTNEIDRFIDLFSSYLKDSKIILLSVTESVLRKRLRCRGHKRVRNSDDFEYFVGNQIRVMIEYRSALVLRGFDLSKGIS